MFHKVDMRQGFPGLGRYFRVPGGTVRPGLSGSVHRSPDFPGPNGETGPNLVWPYTERPPPFNARDMDLPPDIPMYSPPQPPLPGPSGAAGGFRPTTVPFGDVDPTAGIRWSNPTTASLVPILGSTPSQQPVLTLNAQRNLLIIQNNSTATAPDTTPVFFVGFNTPVPASGFGLALAAGIGIVFDIICPRDSVYVLQVGGGGASLVIAGVVVQGTYAPLTV